MSRNAISIIIIIVLLVMVGAATVILPAIQEQLSGSSSDAELSLAAENEPIEIELGGYLLGEELEKIPFLNDLVNGQQVNPLLLLVGSLVIVGGAVVTFGLVLAGVMLLLGRIVTNTYNNERYQEATKTLVTREQEENKELAKTQPPTAIPDHTRLKWQAYSSIAIILFFAGIIAFVVADSLNVDVQTSIFAAVVTFFTALIALLLIRPEKFIDIEKKDAAAVNWSVIWVTVSGLIFLGFGLGLMVAIRSVTG